MSSKNNTVNRRQFLSTVTAATGLLALGTPGALADGFSLFGNDKTGRRVGISDKAYRRAWKRAEAMVSQMTLDEKISQLGSSAAAIERLKIPHYNYYTGEALHGITQESPATSFPMPLALAAAWNPELALKTYTAVSDEARAYDNRWHRGLSYYSPVTLNLHRDPRWGRCAEAPGEDPCLASTIGVQMIRGMQGDDREYLKTTGSSKHYICNNTDGDRTAISADPDQRSFWEYYTRAYRATILDGDSFCVMSAYSSFDGVPCSASHFLLTDLLRGQWGFRGYVTSDCDAINNIYNPHHYAATQPIAAAMAIEAGCDLNCGGTLQKHLKEAVNQGLIGEEEISLSATRMFTVRCLLGLFDSPAKVGYTRIPFDVVDSPKHRALALEAARQSLVLLKNENQFLPLKKNSIRKIALIGPMAGICHLGGYSGGPKVLISPYRGIAESLGVPVQLPYTPASDVISRDGGIRLQSSSEGEMNLGYIADGTWAEFPKTNFTGKTEFQARVSCAEAGGATIEVHLDKFDGPLACTLTVPRTGGWQKWKNVSAPLTGITGEHSIFFKFKGSGTRILNLERFQLNPITPPQYPPGSPQVVFKPGCSVTGDKDDTMFQEAVDAAKDADVVILACGIDESVCREGHDRETIELTGAQPELIKAVYAANPKTVLVLSTVNSLSIEWEQQNIPAIICATCAGQAQGTAIAEVLFGEYNPGGKLPCTWYRSLDELPDFHDYDIHKGRTYMYFEGDPLYHFGYGLSYTTFALDNLKIEKPALGPGDKTTVSADVTNTGNRAGAEVVQLYITAPSSPVKRPIKQLAGFHRVELKPGEKKTVAFDLPFSEQAFWYWDTDTRKFVVQPGTAKILVGNSSANILLTGELTLKDATEPLPKPDFVETVAVKSSVA
ncbi:MAG TPA: glycoside hydrolase family 3 C-terminal domain-containing protein [Verrucomicrobiae bacterium]|jgi:beta-glucosidase|nr:glycoside hydrolase family 3 C-terminal domain-containing protein [Verrucomicrobiae bacterium]